MLFAIILLTAAGVYFTVRFGFFQAVRFPRIIKCSLTALKAQGSGVSALSAVATALGGTVGVGSILGMGYAVSSGGAGSIFWMWVCSFFGMMTKYAETFIAVKYRKKDGNMHMGGTMYCLEAKGKHHLASLFAVLCIIASFGGGNIAQTNAVSVAFGSNGVSELLCAVCVAVLLALIVFRGQIYIARANAVLIPLASLTYIIMLIILLIMLRGNLCGAFTEIITSAFGLRQAASGAAGTMIMRAFRVGCDRGTFSHEAGMGSSPLAHSTAENALPEIQGMWGIVEVFIDTFVVGTLTAVCLIAAGTTDLFYLFTSAFGTAGNIYLLCAVTVFALAAIISWCFYSESCIKYLFAKPRIPTIIYKAVLIVFAFAGCIIVPDVSWKISDIFNYSMIFPNIYALILMRKEIHT